MLAVESFARTLDRMLKESYNDTNFSPPDDLDACVLVYLTLFVPLSLSLFLSPSFVSLPICLPLSLSLSFVSLSICLPLALCLLCISTHLSPSLSLFFYSSPSFSLLPLSLYSSVSLSISLISLLPLSLSCTTYSYILLNGTYQKFTMTFKTTKLKRIY